MTPVAAAGDSNTYFQDPWGFMLTPDCPMTTG
jgi:hypothetical protein